MAEVYCTKCKSNKVVKAGKVWRGGNKRQQYQCQKCGRRFVPKRGGR